MSKSCELTIHRETFISCDVSKNIFTLVNFAVELDKQSPTVIG